MAKAFSLLDDDTAKTPSYSNPYHNEGGSRIGTAPSGGATAGGYIGAGMQRSNYTGSDGGDSEYDRRSGMGGQVPSLGLQQNSTFGFNNPPADSGIGTLNVGGSRRSG